MLFLPSLKRTGHLDGVSLTLVFVGSRKLKEFGETYDDWSSIFAPNLRIYGIDADATVCEQMNAENAARGINWFERHYPLGLWSSAGRQTLNITQYPGCSSLLKPRDSYMTRYSSHQQMMKVVGTRTVDVTTLDDFCAAEAIDQIDYLQVDVQGGGMEVLKGGARMVSSGVLALVSEADFIQAYEGAALFGDVDVYLRARGFSLFDLVGNHHGSRATFPLNSQQHNGPLEWSDAFYFRDLLEAQYDGHAMNTPTALLKLACIADCMNFIDFAAEVLEYITLTFGQDPRFNFAANIIDTIEAVPAITADVRRQLPVYERMTRLLGRTPAPNPTAGVYTISAPSSQFGAGGNVMR